MSSESQISKLMSGILALYFMTVPFAAVYYNWQFAKENGFIQWMLFGEIVPTAQAIVWPYFALGTSAPSDEETQASRYLTIDIEVNEALQEQGKTWATESTKVQEMFDAKRQSDPDGAGLFLADSMDVMLAGMKPLLAKMANNKPTERLRGHHELVVGCAQSQVNALTNAIASLRRQDMPAYADEMRNFQSTQQSCTGETFTERVRATLESAGYHSADDIDRAVERGRAR